MFKRKYLLFFISILLINCFSFFNVCFAKEKTNNKNISFCFIGNQKLRDNSYNNKIEKYVSYYLNEERNFLIESLKRSKEYLPMITTIFNRANIPEELAYLALIESGFRADAVSNARAVGLWQFMKKTARHYGLMVGFFFDDRYNPKLSTKAVVKYLSHLYNKFGSWDLAMAAYNYGEGNLLRIMKKYKANTFGELIKKKVLPYETQEFVPKIFAIIKIVKNQAKYDIKY